jgi:hypothetical protein
MRSKEAINHPAAVEGVVAEVAVVGWREAVAVAEWQEVVAAEDAARRSSAVRIVEVIGRLPAARGAVRLAPNTIASTLIRPVVDLSPPTAQALASASSAPQLGSLFPPPGPCTGRRPDCPR